MTRSWAGALAAVALAGCQRPDVRDAHRAEQRLAMVKSSDGSKDDVCVAARAVAAAWLKALDQQRYQTAKITADLACNDAELERLMH